MLQSQQEQAVGIALAEKRKAQPMSDFNNSQERTHAGSTEPAAGYSNSPQPLTVRCGTQGVAVLAADIRTHEQRMAAVQQFAGQHSLTCDLQSFLHWPKDVRRCYLWFLYLLSRQVPNMVFAGTPGQTPATDLLQIVTDLICPTLLPEHCERAINAAVEVAAPFHTEGLTAACNRIHNTVRHHGMSGYRVSKLERLAHEFINASRDSQDDSSESLVSGIWPTLPNTDGMFIPTGWKASDAGVLRYGEDESCRFNAPILVTQRLLDAKGGSHFVELTWWRAGRWHRRIVPREMLASARSIVELARYDVPVNSNNAADLIDYLDAFEARNLSVIPQAVVSDQMGWVGENGVDGFLVGHRLHNQYQPSGMNIEGVRQPVEFQGADQGNEQLADSLHPHGSFEAWLGLVASVRNYPRVLLGIYSSFVAPLLMVLKLRGFVLSYAGPTSGGKTTTLVCAAATWGCPDPQEPGSLMMTWDATRVGREQSIYTLNGIPLIVDDTKQARSPEDVSQAVYDITGGRGRARGSQHGLAVTGTWRSMMITSGEQPLSSFTQDGGTRARIIEIWNSPFGQTSAEMARHVTALRDGFIQHYGQGGPRFVDFLIANKAQWPVWEQRYREIRSRYETSAGNNSVAFRMTTYLAVIELAALMAHEALGFSWQYEDTVWHLSSELTQGAAEADRAVVAMRHLINSFVAQRHRFADSMNAANSTAPIGGYMGVWSIVTSFSGQEACRAVFPQFVSELLRREGFEPNSIKRMWRDRGLTVTNPDKLSLKCRICGEPTEVIAIPIRVINELMGEGVPPVSPRPRGIVGGNLGSGTREQGENSHNC